MGGVQMTLDVVEYSMEETLIRSIGHRAFCSIVT